MIVYVCHFERKLAHAQHYIGTAKSPWHFYQRIKLHRMGQGAKILKACNDQGIKWKVVFKTWGSYNLERQMKAQKNAAKFCPICTRKAAAQHKRDRRKYARINRNNLEHTTSATITDRLSSGVTPTEGRTTRESNGPAINTQNLPTRSGKGTTLDNENLRERARRKALRQ